MRQKDQQDCWLHDRGEIGVKLLGGEDTNFREGGVAVSQKKTPLAPAPAPQDKVPQQQGAKSDISPYNTIQLVQVYR